VSTELSSADSTLGPRFHDMSGRARESHEQGEDRPAPAGQQDADARDPVRVLFLEPEGLTPFLDGIVEGIDDSPEFEASHVRLSSLSDRLPLNRADIVWLEWANELAVAMTRRFPVLRRKKVIVRLHRYEAFTPHPGEVNWDVVDRLLFVSSHMKDLFAERFTGVEVESNVIHNGVDMERFSPAQRGGGAGDIAFAAHLNHRKNLPLLLQIAVRLRQAAGDRAISMAGDWQHPMLRRYVEHLCRRTDAEAVISHDGWVSDMPGWLAGASYLLSTSMHESFGYSICEGMACGLKPVIHHFPGAREFYPDEFLFSTVDEAVNMLREPPRKPQFYRGFVADNYSRRRQVGEVRRLLLELAGTTAKQGGIRAGEGNR